ncbi:MAG TPA: hypothetical protein VML55_09820 [Planctomycetaceae bacterium]|nr:hypothetical protein [Planctomycetaceae bacterium]
MSDNGLRPHGKLTREAAIEAVRRMHEELGRPVSRREFLARTGLNGYWLDRTFPGAWAEVRNLTGMEPVRQNVRYSDDELLGGFHRAVAELGWVPRWIDLKRLAGFSASTFRRRWGRMQVIRDSYRDWLQQHHPDSPLRHIIDAAPPPRPGPPRLLQPQRHRSSVLRLPPSRRGRTAARARPLSGRTSRRPPGASAGLYAAPARCPASASPRFGEPIDCLHMRHAPINEQGVVLLFGILVPELGFLVESVQNGFPDCEAKQPLDEHGRAWRHVRIEFEYKSRNFRDHGHDPAACDLLVCWLHDWPDCPLEVLELQAVVAAGVPDHEPSQ